jgi:hypothetical protein
MVGRAVENPQVPAGWGAFVDEDEPDEVPEVPEVPEEVDDEDVLEESAATGAFSEDSLPRLSVR